MGRGVEAPPGPSPPRAPPCILPPVEGGGARRDRSGDADHGVSGGGGAADVPEALHRRLSLAAPMAHPGPDALEDDDDLSPLLDPRAVEKVENPLHRRPAPAGAPSALDPAVVHLLAGVDHFRVVQRIRWKEAVGSCFGLFPKWPGSLWKQLNLYDVFDVATGEKLLELEEESNGCVRFCCAPHHSFRLNFHVVDAHTGARVAHAATMQRDACCTAKPFAAACCAFAECCFDGFRLHAGRPGAGAGGRGLDQSRCFAAARQSLGGGILHPELQMMERAEGFRSSGEPDLRTVAETRGPACFGGCSSLCVANSFTVGRGMNPAAAVITRERPRDVWGALRELGTDADVYTVEMREPHSAEQKAQLLATAAMLDYQWFEWQGAACLGPAYTNACLVHCCGRPLATPCPGPTLLCLGGLCLPLSGWAGCLGGLAGLGAGALATLVDSRNKAA